MLSGHGSFVRFAVIVSVLSSSFLVPSCLAQLSSSADNNAAFDKLVQDQYPNQGGYNRQTYHHNDTWSDHLAIEAGAGLNVAAGNTRTWQDVGYSINLGAGWNFNKRFGVLAEYGFNRSQYSAEHVDERWRAKW